MSNQRQHKENYGAFFVNNKDGNESRADYTGEININGTTYRLAGWKKTSKGGTTYLSLAAEVKTEKSNGGGF